LAAFESSPDSDGRITQAFFGFSFDERGSERRELVAWLKNRMRGTSVVEARAVETAYGCGVATSGPAWVGREDAEPEVQLALTAIVPWDDPPHGEDMASLFINTKAQRQAVCFMQPHATKKMGRVQHARSASVMREFVRSTLFRDRTRPTGATMSER
jgi:hypothetical protein